jgi:transposase
MSKPKQSTFERLTGGKLNRKQRKQLGRRLYSDNPGLEVVHRHAAGIDIGNESHYVAVAPGCDPEPVREFGSWTAALHQMADWLESIGVKHVVMQSTGVYWIAVYDVLQSRGFAVCLTNARETKNLPGRKTDVQESQWLLKLHTYGLLRNSFRPPEEIRVLRTIWRLRNRHVEDAGREIQHMQKALTTMNVQLANVISDVSGVTGQAIVRAILKGERDPYQLAELRHYSIKASKEEIARSLEGHWQQDVLFELQQAVDRYDFCQQQIAECDHQLEKYLADLPIRTRAQPEEPATDIAPHAEGKPKEKRKRARAKPRKNQPNFNLEEELARICGVNLASIDGIDVMTIQTWVSELGVDMTPWPTEHHLVSWLKLAPRRPITGGKLIKQERNKAKNRVADALRMAASTLRESDSYLGARFRCLRGRLGPPIAIKAMAAYLARLIYRMLTRGQAWVDEGARVYQQRRQERDKRALERRAAALGLRLVSAD